MPNAVATVADPATASMTADGWLVDRLLAAGVLTRAPSPGVIRWTGCVLERAPWSRAAGASVTQPADVKGGRTIIGNARHHALEQMLEGVPLVRRQAAEQRRQGARSRREDGVRGTRASLCEHQSDRAAISTRTALDQPAIHQP